MSERQKFNRWYVNTFADADGRFTHLPRWHKADVWLAWQAARPRPSIRRAAMTARDVTQELLDKFYFEHGQCCAGCDWWHHFNGVVGECHRSAPVSDAERWAMLGIERCSLEPASGHVVTSREHVCGDFKDEFDWSSLPLPYRKRVGALRALPDGGVDG